MQIVGKEGQTDLDIIDHPVLGELLKEEKITIFFEGEAILARLGQTIASALIGNGVYNLGNSRNLVKPRGLFCSNGRCCSCYMTVNKIEHVRTCVTLVEEGMKIQRNTSDPDVRREPNES